MSSRSWAETHTSTEWRVDSGPLCTAKCLGLAITWGRCASGPCMPRTKALANVPVRKGSSPYVSWPRPQRGSRKMLMLGDQVSSEPPMRFGLGLPRPSAYTARTSVLMLAATSCSRRSLKLAASPTGCGKLVVAPGPKAPCSDSVHQL